MAAEDSLRKSHVGNVTTSAFLLLFVLNAFRTQWENVFHSRPELLGGIARIVHSDFVAIAQID